MSEDPDFCQIDKRITVGKLFDAVFIVCQGIITQIIVSISMIPFLPHRASSPMAEIHHHKAHLG